MNAKSLDPYRGLLSRQPERQRQHFFEQYAEHQWALFIIEARDANDRSRVPDPPSAMLRTLNVGRRGMARIAVLVLATVLVLSWFSDSSSNGGSGNGSPDWVADALAVQQWDCYNARAFDDQQSTVSCTCAPGFSSNAGDNAPFCFSDHPCCILERVGNSYSCRCREGDLVTDQPSMTDQACDADAMSVDRVCVDECPPQ